MAFCSSLVYDERMMKRLVLYICVAGLILIGAGCARKNEPTPVYVPPQDAPPVSVPLRDVTDEDVNWIQMNAEGATIPRPTGFSSSWVMPEGIRLGQVVRHAYLLTEETAFVAVDQSNANMPLRNSEGGDVDTDPVSFAGLIFTKDGGKTWARSFSIPTSSVSDDSGPVHANVVGVWFDGEQDAYVLDVADDRGAGSGEGNLMRFRTVNGKEWIRDSLCFSFVPESYYIEYGSGPLWSLEINKDVTAKPIDCPPYADSLMGE